MAHSTLTFNEMQQLERRHRRWRQRWLAVVLAVAMLDGACPGETSDASIGVGDQGSLVLTSGAGGAVWTGAWNVLGQLDAANKSRQVWDFEAGPLEPYGALSIPSTVVRGPLVVLSTEFYPLPERVRAGTTSLELSGSFQALVPMSGVVNYVLIDCWAEERQITSLLVRRNVASQVTIEAVMATWLQVHASAEAVALYQAASNSTIHLGIYAGRTDKLPLIVVTTTLRAVLQTPQPSSSLATLALSLPSEVRDLLAAQGQSLYAMLHDRSYTYVYPIILPANGTQIRTAVGRVTGEAWFDDLTNQLAFRPGTTRFRVGLLLNHPDFNIPAESIANATTILNNFAIREVINL
ncbi:uncharacterized protein MONBRDRAFT_12869 [Monosiga brevicollis MX1]|uniref:Uncharacterized protein n=1 Tax=Monosiga brevicollis TaxID=81824 RepID=A9VDK3_MONBE|nr:uncharacterized protein MONBRDRAFT_12869 [Monosiga brevicollis MX1]EDQ84410.1 predicted protein [Monosiga brevicollis MX1]|eukprot:XP_001750811.1 hypothetical protein [Monosiga brevicollis MX1]